MLSFVIIAIGSDIEAIVSAALKFGSRYHTRHEPGAFRLGRVHHASRQTHFHGFRLADEPRETLTAAHPRRDPELDLGLAELRGIRG